MANQESDDQQAFPTEPFDDSEFEGQPDQEITDAAGSIDDGDFRTGFEETVRRRERAEQLQQDVQQEYPFLDEQDIVIRQEGGRFVPAFRGGAEDEVLAHQIAAGRDDLERADIAEVERTDDGARAILTDEARRERAAASLDEQVAGRTVTTEDVVETEEGFRLSEDFFADDGVEPPDPYRDFEIRIERDEDGAPQVTRRREVTGGTINRGPSEEALIAAGLERELGEDVDPDDIEDTDEGFIVARDEGDVQTATERPQDDGLPDDVAVIHGESGDETSTTEVEEAVAETIDEQFDGSREAVTHEIEGETVAREQGEVDGMIEEPDIDFTGDDVEVDGDEVRLTAGAAREIRQETTPSTDALERIYAARQLDEQLSGPREAVTNEFEGGTLAREQGAVDGMFDSPDIDVATGDIVRAEDGEGLTLDQETTRLLQQHEIASGLTAQGIDADPEDVRVTDDGVELSDDVQTELEQRQLETAAGRIEQQIALGQVTDGMAPERATALEQTARADDVALPDAPVDIDADDLAFVGSGDDQRIAFTDEADVRVTEQLVEAETGMVAGEDFEVTEAYPDRIFRETDADPGLTVELTPEGRRTQILEQAEQDSEIGGIPIEDAESQLEFDDQGRVVNVSLPADGADAPDPDGFLGAVAAGLARAEQEVSDLPGSGVVGSAATSVGGGIVTTGGVISDRVEPLTSPVVSASADARDFVDEEFVDPTFDAIEPENEGLRIITEGGRSVVDWGTNLTIGAPAYLAGATETTVGVTRFTGEQIADRGVVRGTQTVLGVGRSVGRAAGEMAVEEFKDDPARATGRALGATAASLGVGAVAGRGIGIAARGSRSRIRTAGATRVDLEDMVQADVLEGRRRFPAAQDRDLYQTQPAEAVRRQADDMTPAEISRRFDEAGVEGQTLFKALDVEPDGPGRGRAARGFDAAPDETGIRPGRIDSDMVQSFADSPGPFAYETPGAFVSPEASVYFLRQAAGESGFSWRPGLPDTGGSPTITAIRTRVRGSDSDTPLEFAQEMVRREGDSIARTKPASSVNPGEVEAVIPPGAQFVDVGTGFVRNTLRRLGVGADFAVDVGGRTVPVRTVAASDDVATGSSAGVRALFRDDRGQVGVGARSPRRVRRDIEETPPVRQPVDRPLPITPTPRGEDRSDLESSITASPAPTEDLELMSEPVSAAPSTAPVEPSAAPVSPAVSTPSVPASETESAPISPTTTFAPSALTTPAPAEPTTTAPSSPTSPSPSLPSSPVPTPPTTPTRPLADIDARSDDADEVEPMFGGSRRGIFTDFIDPLSGEVRETEEDVIEPELTKEPLLGFEERRS